MGIASLRQPPTLSITFPSSSAIMKLATATLCILSLFATADAIGIFPEQQQILGPGPTRPAPNFIFVITDDQDLQLDSVDYMPSTLKHVKQKGTFFRNHFVTTALCCPSRVSLWTGQQAHNTNVTDVSPPYGASLHPDHELSLTIHQEAILSLLTAASMTTSCQFGCRTRGTTRTILASCSTPTLSITITAPLLTASMAPTSCWTPSPTLI